MCDYSHPEVVEFEVVIESLVLEPFIHFPELFFFEAHAMVFVKKKIVLQHQAMHPVQA